MNRYKDGILDIARVKCFALDENIIGYMTMLTDVINKRSHNCGSGISRVRYSDFIFLSYAFVPSIVALSCSNTKT